MSGNINHIVFDLDDTVVGTRDYACSNIKVLHRGNIDLVNAVEQLRVRKQPAQTAPAWVSGPVWDVLKDGEFMLKAGYTKSLAACIDDFKLWIDEQIQKGKTFSICSHRGIYDNGYMYTMQWLNNRGLDKYFTHVHVIDSSENPNKLEFLNKLYGDRFLLIDDNPIHHESKVHIPVGADRNVLVCRTENEFQHVKALPGITNIRELFSIV